MAKHTLTIYRTIKIDAEYDTDKQTNPEELASEIASMVVSRASAHNHTIEEGIQITDITNCGESV